MNRFKNLLLIQSVREQSALTALQRAVWLARQNQARLTVVDLLESLPNSARSQDYQDLLVEGCKAQLEELVAPYRTDGLNIETEVLSGETPVVSIVQKVLQSKIDMVLKDAQPDGAARRFSGLDMQLMRKCPVPLWVIRPDYPDQVNRVMAAVDPDLQDSERNTLNTLIMDLATSLSRMDNAELNIVHAWRLKGETELRCSAFVRLPEEEVDRLLEEECRHHETNLNALLAKYNLEDIQPNIEMIKGPAGQVLPTVAREKNVDLLIMGTIGRSGLPGLIMGNTAETVLQVVDCSVLTLKPDGFKSPIEF